MTRAQRAYQQALKLIETLETAGFEARLVGGCVRDRQLNLEPKDYDIATTALPEEVQAVFAKGTWKLIPTGLSHGTITVVTKSGPMEITTLRRDTETDGRHAVVAFGASFEEDAARRDFTFNAMSEDRHGQVFDYFSGKKDLQQGKVRFVGNAEERITEDYLRILRYFRFWARFGRHYDREAAAAIQKFAPRVAQVSQERVTSELLQILEAEKPETVVKTMAEWGVLSVALGPEATNLEGLNHTPFPRPRPELSLYRLSKMLGRTLDGKSLQALVSRLRLSNRQGKILQAYLCLWQDAPEATASIADLMAYWDDAAELMGEEDLMARTLPVWLSLYPEHTSTWQALERYETEKGWLRRSKLPVSGHDVVAALSIEGPQLGEVMKRLVKAFRNGLFTNREEALSYLKTLWKE